MMEEGAADAASLEHVRKQLEESRAEAEEEFHRLDRLIKEAGQAQFGDDKEPLEQEEEDTAAASDRADIALIAPSRPPRPATRPQGDQPVPRDVQKQANVDRIQEQQDILLQQQRLLVEKMKQQEELYRRLLPPHAQDTPHIRKDIGNGQTPSGQSGESPARPRRPDRPRRPAANLIPFSPKSNSSPNLPTPSSPEAEMTPAPTPALTTPPTPTAPPPTTNTQPTQTSTGPSVPATAAAPPAVRPAARMIKDSAEIPKEQPYLRRLLDNGREKVEARDTGAPVQNAAARAQKAAAPVQRDAAPVQRDAAPLQKVVEARGTGAPVQKAAADVAPTEQKPQENEKESPAPKVGDKKENSSETTPPPKQNDAKGPHRARPHHHPVPHKGLPPPPKPQRDAPPSPGRKPVLELVNDIIRSSDGVKVDEKGKEKAPEPGTEEKVEDDNDNTGLLKDVYKEFQLDRAELIDTASMPAENSFESYVMRKTSVDDLKEDYLTEIIDDQPPAPPKSSGDILMELDFEILSRSRSQTGLELRSSPDEDEDEGDEDGKESTMTFRDFLLTTPPPDQQSPRSKTKNISKLMEESGASPSQSQETETKKLSFHSLRMLSPRNRVKKRFRTQSFYEQTAKEKREEAKRAKEEEKQQKQAQKRSEKSQDKEPDEGTAQGWKKKISSISRLRLTQRRRRSKTIPGPVVHDTPENNESEPSAPVRVYSQEERLRLHETHIGRPVPLPPQLSPHRTKEGEKEEPKEAKESGEGDLAPEAVLPAGPPPGESPIVNADKVSTSLRNDPTLGDEELAKALNRKSVAMGVLGETTGYLTLKQSPEQKKARLDYFVLIRNTMFYYEKADQSKPLGKISLNGAWLETMPRSGNNGPSLGICDAKGNRAFTLEATSQEELDEWLLAIQACSIAGVREGK